MRLPFINRHAKILVFALGPVLPLAVLAAVLYELATGTGMKGRAHEAAVSTKGAWRLFCHLENRSPIACSRNIGGPVQWYAGSLDHVEVLQAILHADRGWVGRMRVGMR